ncbi:MAG: hypothetical protein ACE5EV_07055 [Gaiellales bacterium]
MKRLVLLLTFAIVLTGCKVRVDSHIAVDEDGSGTFAIEMSLDEEFRELSEESGEGGIDFEEGIEDIPSGWSVEPFVDGEFEGIRAAVDFTDFADLDQRLIELAESGDADTSAPTFLDQSGLTRDGDQFTFTTELTGLEDDLADFGGGGEGDFTLEGFDPAALFEQVFEIRFVVSLPGTIVSNNADSVDGNTLTWNVGFEDEGRTLQAVSDVGGSSSSVPVLGVVALVVAVVLGLALFLRRRRPGTPKGHVADPPDGPVTGGDSLADPWAGVDEETADVGEPAHPSA